MRAVLILLLWLLPGWVSAQGAATLVADSVTLQGDGQLIAQGNIEVYYAGTRLTAAQITYDRLADQLAITGPIIITTPQGVILTADSAELDPQLRNGLLRSARLVLDQQLQLAANQIDRADGRLSQLYKTAVTSCQVCGTDAPLWEIRAERVVHDEDAQQLYFTNATFHLRGTPIFWLPRMRLPDPSLTRATGFLIPRIRTTNQLGTGIKLPYFLTIGDYRDLTFTPYVSPKTLTLETRYRQAFASGLIEANAAISRDTLQPDTNRSYIFAEGEFDLGRAYRLNFDIEAVSDPAYLLEYGYSDKDRLDSAISLTRVRANDLLTASFTYYQSLRDDEVDAVLPPIVADFSYTRRSATALGGTLTLGASGDVIARYGTEMGEDGRDVGRLGLAADWQETWVSAAGLETRARAGLTADWYRLNDATAFASGLSRAVPSVAVTFRFPLVKRSATARHLLEPVVALAWSETYGDTPPNEDSTRPELDEANLFALSRFPGEDAVETGFRTALGMSYTRAGNSGAITRLTFGRVIRDVENVDFTLTSGLKGIQSDWLLAGQLELPQGIVVMGRTLLADSLDPTLASVKIDWTTAQLALDASYIWQAADPDLGRADAVSEIALNTRTQVSDAWAVSLDARYDLANRTPAQAGLGAEWRNECVAVDFSISRRFTSSSTVDPSTDYGLSVVLNGFSAGRAGGGPAAQCKQ